MQHYIHYKTMVKYPKTFLTVIFFFSFSISAFQLPPSYPPSYTNFVKDKCEGATDPSLCLKTLLHYAAFVQNDPLNLCIAALKISIDSAHDVSQMVKKMAKDTRISSFGAAVLKDCIGEMKDAVYEMKEGLTAMGQLGGFVNQFQWDSAKTRVSAAITDAETCKNGFYEKRTDPAIKSKIIKRVSGVQKLISNALYLLNNLY